MPVSSFDRVVANMMRNYGTTATLVVPSDQGTYDALTSEYVTPEVEYVVRILVFDYTLQSNGDQSMKNTLIGAGDKQVFVQPLNKTDSNLTMPEIRPEKDYIVFGGVRYRIITVKHLNPSLQDNILFELLARK
jgi:hypothetical protein